MHEKGKNESFAKQAFDSRVKDSKKKAIEENIKLAEKTGSTLTQNIDDEGNLYGVNTQQINMEKKKEDTNEAISVSDIRSELFEGDNIVTKPFKK